jgi:hypothetical protein
MVTSQTQEITLHAIQTQICVAWQKSQMGQFLFPRNAFIEYRHVHNQRRQAHPGRGAGMDFIVQFTPLGVFWWQKAGGDFVHDLILTELHQEVTPSQVNRLGCP